MTTIIGGYNNFIIGKILSSLFLVTVQLDYFIILMEVGTRHVKSNNENHFICVGVEILSFISY